MRKLMHKSFNNKAENKFINNSVRFVERRALCTFVRIRMFTAKFVREEGRK